MKIIHAPRASAILYQLLAGRKRRHPWLLPANICPVVPETFVKAGVPFEFVDISNTTLHMDLDQAAARMMSRQIAGLVYAHTYGEPSTPNSFFRLARSLHPEILIVDDRCLCTPEFKVSSIPDVVLFSTGYAKIVDLNFGGYAFVQKNIRLPQTNAELPGWDAYRGQIEAKLESSLTQRAALNEIYVSRLPAEIQMPGEFQQWRFNIRVRNKSAVMRAIFENALFASSHYASLAGVMSDGSAPEAESLASNVINLFNDHHFDAGRAERVCEIVLKHS
jgi:dTDP-4-amino-4,6-dideoxygalactose transaminase